MPCNNQHIERLDEQRLEALEEHQMHGNGRHKCCQCAYNQGYQQGLDLLANISLNIAALGDSQAERDGRHKSVHQAFALGYADGVQAYIESQR
ncbi:hypothetical protein VOA_000125 [Vibrio sp. RC586]|uniref:hypothetical protein n=1 Tax=Vibrio sp. RC586 TaxID=675815 RepID=UPI0001BB80D2|nr:hypothetical protein [Vibrio sp. RC586]EEZ00062.1 hypothetical protein VOA_000110 [Vibrio sp. RC586]EEZ00067.1 hypothetical protein VOA_000115 [Vibrio sp. RC586]EEZ00072.1 hypothetical protein VOA_000120 [Vibrio sp. RC586]EEZ00077.1 hypothetical protein VOA_000125 [Vibrio sp. RC586]